MYSFPRLFFIIFSFLTASLLFQVAESKTLDSKITINADDFKRSSSSFILAANIYKKARELEKQSIKSIRYANNMRKTMHKLNALNRKNPSDLKKISNRVDLLKVINSQESAWQNEGRQLREYGKVLNRTAQQLMRNSFEKEWSHWVHLYGPILLEKEGKNLTAHNVKIRSSNTALETTSNKSHSTHSLPKKTGMSLKIPSMSGQNIPGDLDTLTFQVSRDLHFFTHVEPVIINKKQTPRVPLNQIHSWNLIVVDQDGKPVKDASIEVAGHMPGHVHGLPTQPRVTKEVSPGVYRVDGIKFQMTGWWVMQFTISNELAKDSSTFNLML